MRTCVPQVDISGNGQEYNLWEVCNYAFLRCLFLVHKYSPVSDSNSSLFKWYLMKYYFLQERFVVIFADETVVNTHKWHAIVCNRPTVLYLKYPLDLFLLYCRYYWRDTHRPGMWRSMVLTNGAKYEQPLVRLKRSIWMVVCLFSVWIKVIQWSIMMIMHFKMSLCLYFPWYNTSRINRGYMHNSVSKVNTHHFNVHSLNHNACVRKLVTNHIWDSRNNM